MSLFHETPGEQWYRFERKLEDLETQLTGILAENKRMNNNLENLIYILSDKDT